MIKMVQHMKGLGAIVKVLPMVAFAQILHAMRRGSCSETDVRRMWI